jgi:hypothetical protein
MYQLVFTILVVSKAGIPGFNIEQYSTFSTEEECLKTKVVMQNYVDRLVKENRTFPGVFDCRKTR